MKALLISLILVLTVIVGRPVYFTSYSFYLAYQASKKVEALQIPGGIAGITRIRSAVYADVLTRYLFVSGRTDGETVEFTAPTGCIFVPGSFVSVSKPEGRSLRPTFRSPDFKKMVFTANVAQGSITNSCSAHGLLGGCRSIVGAAIAYQCP